MKRVLAILAIPLGVMCCTAQAQNLVPANDVAFVTNADLADLAEVSAADNCSCCDEPCLGSICTRQRLFDNVFGPASPLTEHGIVTDFILGQYWQGVTTGGDEQTGDYGGDRTDGDHGTACHARLEQSGDGSPLLRVR